MDALSTLASSGMTITLSPAQILVAASVLGVVFASNAKSVLFAWHGRLFTQLARHLLLGRAQLTVKSAHHGGASIFAPVVTSSYTPLLDIDYNLHKSNSTFFVDLDDNRTELMLALFKDAVKPLKTGKNTPKPRMFNLGGTSCMYRKAIPPFAKYEISSRVLCWDQKWIYVVSHFTKSGSNTPTNLVLGSKGKQAERADIKDIKDTKDCIYATAITKYVFKQGRITCTPESVMSDCGLLPQTKSGQEDDSWDWSLEQVQEECDRYLEVAQNFGSLDKLHDAFIGRSGPAMYFY